VKRSLLLALVCGLLTAVVCFRAAAQDDPASDDLAGNRAKVALDQERVKIKFRELQNKLEHLAEITAATDPVRAELLKKVLKQGRDEEIEEQLTKLVAMLREERLGAAESSQKEVREDLAKLLEILLKESGPNKLADEMKRLKEYLAKVKLLIKDEMEIEEQMRSGVNPGQVGSRQERVAGETKKLADDIARNDGSKSGDGKSKDGKGGDGKSGDGKSGEGKSGDGKSGKSGDGKSGDGKSKSGDGKSGDGKSGKSGDGKSGDGKSGKSGDGKSGDGKSGKSGDGKSGDGKSGKSDGKGGEGKGSEGKSGKSGDGKGAEGKSGKSKGGEGAEGDPRQEPEEGGGGDSEGEPPPANKMDSTKKRLYEAEKRMREAKQKLEQAQREGAAEEARKATEELKKIEKELEELLRQLREEELERLLAFLEARFKKMLQMQVAVYEGTLRLDRVPQAKRDRTFLTQSGRLNRDESLIEIEADKALRLLREDGTSVAMSESVTEMIDDIKQVQVFLSRGETGNITQGVEEDIIAALEEMIEALKKAQKELSDKKGRPGQPGQPPDPSLIDVIAELKMLRSMQLRVNRRTERFRRELENPEDEIGQAQKADLKKGLDELSDRQERIFNAARDLATGRNR
jgi:hypothetical protein